jgi:hypothetical protein
MAGNMPIEQNLRNARGLALSFMPRHSAEWLNAAVLKTAEHARGREFRILRCAALAPQTGAAMKIGDLCGAGSFSELLGARRSLVLCLFQSGLMRQPVRRGGIVIRPVQQTPAGAVPVNQEYTRHIALGGIVRGIGQAVAVG